MTMWARLYTSLISSIQRKMASYNEMVMWLFGDFSLSDTVYNLSVESSEFWSHQGGGFSSIRSNIIWIDGTTDRQAVVIERSGSSQNRRRMCEGPFSRRDSGERGKESKLFWLTELQFRPNLVDCRSTVHYVFIILPFNFLLKVKSSQIGVHFSAH